MTRARTATGRASAGRALAVAALALLLGAAMFLMLDRLFPFPVERLEPPPAVRVMDREGRPLRFFLAEDGMWRFPLGPDEVPPDLAAALVASEDRHFYSHPGVNPLSVLRAAWSNLRYGRVVSGASTIPMQVARLAEPSPRTFGAKMVEAFRALQLCLHHPRKQILLWYLNLAPFGSNVVGVGAAAWHYFGKDPRTLSLGEIALLSVLPRAPSRYNPLRNPAEARRVRDSVLSRFAAQGVFARARIEESRTRPLLASRAPVPQDAPHFTRWLRSRMAEQSATQSVLRSSIDSRTQAILGALLAGRIDALRREAIGNAAAVVLRVQTREVLAYAGSADFWDDANQGQVDNALARRSPGSTLKPLLYALAFDQGHLVPGSMLLDVPTDFAGYVPENYGRDFQGLVSARTALSTSLNVPAARLLARCGVGPFLGLLRGGGLSTLERPAADYGLSLALGGCEARLLELTNLYADLAAGGVHKPVQPLAATPGDAEPEERLVSAEAAAMVLDILAATRRPDLPDAWQFTVDAPRAAWKTGTSFGHRDAWAVGVNRDLAIGVWVGNPDGSQCKDISGARHAAPLLFDLFRALAPGPGQPFDFPAPSLTQTTLCAVSGDRAGPLCADTVRSPAIAGVTALPVCSMHRRIFVDRESGLRLHGDCLLTRPSRPGTAVVWPAELVAFRQARGVPLTGLPAVHPACPDVPGEGAPVIQSPSPDTPYVERPEAPPEFQRLSLLAAPAPGAATHYWYVDGRFAGKTAPLDPCFIPMTAGTHEITVTDDLGRTARSSCMVLTPQAALGSPQRP